MAFRTRSPPGSGRQFSDAGAGAIPPERLGVCRASSVSDFVLHAAKQNGCAILQGIIRCRYFPDFPSVADQVFRFCGSNAVLSCNTAPADGFRPFRLAACRERVVAEHAKYPSTTQSRLLSPTGCSLKIRFSLVSPTGSCALRRPDSSFDFPPPRGGIRSLSVGAVCLATKSRALSGLLS